MVECSFKNLVILGSSPVAVIKKILSAFNGKQSIKVEEGTMEFEKYFKQTTVPFKIKSEFECNLESVESYEDSYTKKYQDHVPCSFGYKVSCIDLVSQLLFLGEKMLFMNLLKQFLRSINIAKK